MRSTSTPGSSRLLMLLTWFSFPISVRLSKSPSRHGLTTSPLRLRLDLGQQGLLSLIADRCGMLNYRLVHIGLTQSVLVNPRTGVGHRRSTLLVGLDLSSAFDTIDNILSSHDYGNHLASMAPRWPGSTAICPTDHSMSASGHRGRRRPPATTASRKDRSSDGPLLSVHHPGSPYN